MGISEFFRTISWGATLTVAAIRIVLAALLWVVIMLLAGSIPNASTFFAMYITLLLVITVAMAVALPAVGLARAGIPFVGLLALPAWLAVLADPIIHVVWKMKPELIPVDHFKLINPPVLALFNTEAETE